MENSELNKKPAGGGCHLHRGKHGTGQQQGGAIFTRATSLYTDNYDSPDTASISERSQSCDILDNTERPSSNPIRSVKKSLYLSVSPLSRSSRSVDLEDPGDVETTRNRKDEKSDLLKKFAKLNLRETKKVKSPAKKILRPPVVSTYTRGLSGLPRRVNDDSLIYKSDPFLAVPKSNKFSRNSNNYTKNIDNQQRTVIQLTK